MKLQRCSKGHFYDEDKFSICPYCYEPKQGDSPSNSETKPVNDMEGVLVYPYSGEDISEQPDKEPRRKNEMKWVNVETDAEDESITQGFFSPEEDKELPGSGNEEKEKNPVIPCTGWLLCIAGRQLGMDFRLYEGKNSIGRGADNNVIVTREVGAIRETRALIVYEPKENRFYVMPGMSRELCYINDELLLKNQCLLKNDTLEFGDSKLMFIPGCDEKFNWDMLRSRRDQ